MLICDAICELQVMWDFKFYLNETRERLLEEWGWKSDFSLEDEVRPQFYV